MVVKAKIHNPYVEELDEKMPFEQMPWGRSRRILGSGDSRYNMVSKYSWAIPSDKALKTIAKYDPIIEIGAGNGYWAYLLQQIGVDILAFDLHTNLEKNYYFGKGVKHWTEVKYGNAGSVTKYPDRTLFLCWPPRGKTMALSCVERYKGNTLLYVGESNYGCCASDAFFRYMDEHFRIDEVVDIEQWTGMHDALYVYKRMK